jgi:hypothetical protein
MKTSITFSSAILALAAVATSCAAVARQTAGPDRVYLVGVAGGG